MQSEDMFQLNTITAITQLSYLFLRFLVQFGSYILSHPLYFSYFIFFSPYILKLLSFLSPLFITTSLFLLAFLTVRNNPYSQHAESKVWVLDLSSYQNVLNTVSWSLDHEEKVDDQFHLFEEFEACMEVLNSDIQILSFQQDLSKELAPVVEEKIVVDSSPCKSDAVVPLHSQPPGLTSNSQEGESPLTKQPLSNVKEHKEKFEMLYSTALTPCGSMRKEKEWKRTLACKLYEERQNIDGSEGMDLLWESYEDDSGKVKKNKKITKAKKEMEYDEEDDEENEVADVKLCCLQALKFSTGKMNLGMGRPNIVKISKAFKGIGWFHHVSKQGKDRVK